MAGRLPRVTGREVLRALARDGWYEDRISGSHVMLRHATKVGKPVAPVHAGQVIKQGTLHRILTDAGLTRDQFRDLL